MPRNPNKLRCQTPGRNSSAMRSPPGRANTAHAGGTPAQPPTPNPRPFPSIHSTGSPSLEEFTCAAAHHNG
jgi:hypothetical protein